MNLINYNSFMLALIIFYSILPLIYKITSITIFKPELILTLLSIPLVLSLKKSNKKSLVVVYFNILFILFNILSGVDYPSKIYEYLLKVIPFALFPSIVGSLIINQKKFNKFLLIFCNINFIILLYIVVFKQEMYSNNNFMNYMTFGYWILPSTLFYIYFYIITNKKKYLLLNSLGICLIFLFGSRFTLLISVLGSIFLKIKFTNNNYMKKKLLILSILSIPIILIVFFYLKSILKNLISICINFQINYTPLRRLLASLEGTPRDVLSGRDFLFNQTLKMISEKPFGNGIFGFMENKMLAGEGLFYPHNIFLEIILHMGIEGIFLILIGLFLIFKQLKILRKNKKNYIIIWILIILNFKLLLTGSYLWDPYFWLLMTLIFSLKIQQEINI